MKYVEAMKQGYFGRLPFYGSLQLKRERDILGEQIAKPTRISFAIFILDLR
jgi:hypothetical protein